MRRWSELRSVAPWNDAAPCCYRHCRQPARALLIGEGRWPVLAEFRAPFPASRGGCRGTECRNDRVGRSAASAFAERPVPSRDVLAASQRSVRSGGDSFRPRCVHSRRSRHLAADIRRLRRRPLVDLGISGLPGARPHPGRLASLHCVMYAFFRVAAGLRVRVITSGISHECCSSRDLARALQHLAMGSFVGTMDVGP